MVGSSCSASACLHGFLNLDELQNAVLHLLDSLVLSQTHTALVGDVVDATNRLSVLTGGTTDLQVVLAGHLLQLLAVGSQLGQLDVHRGTDGSAQVGRAEGEEAQAVVVREGNLLLNVLDGLDEATEDLLQIAALLHGDDAKMI